MPRPTRAQGRPGTRIFPADFEQSHAAVVQRAATAVVDIFAPPVAGQPVMGSDFTYSDTAPADPLHTAQPARIQVLNGQETSHLVADQDHVTVGYLVVVPLALDVPLNAVVRVTACADPTLVTARRLVVRKIARGSVQWERDLWCVDDLTTTP